MNKLLEDKFKKGKKGKILYGADWYAKEEFYKKDTAKMRWALVSKDIIPNSTSQNYLQQTQELKRYITDTVFKNEALPQEYKDAIDEFEQYYTNNFQGKTNPEIQQLLGGTNWPKYTQELGNLKINQLTRQNPEEALYDSLMYFQQTGKRLLEKHYTWTKRRSSDGSLVSVGSFVADGAHVAAGALATPLPISAFLSPAVCNFEFWILILLVVFVIINLG